MFWKRVSQCSIVNRLLFIYLISIVVILGSMTWILYPPLKDLMIFSKSVHHEPAYLLTKWCFKKLFIGLWLAAGGTAIISYYLVNHSLRHIDLFSKELALIHADALEKRLTINHHPKELESLAITCNNMLSRIDAAFKHLTQFAAGIAHELRTPLHYLQNATEVTLAKPQTTDTYEQLLNTHLEEYEHLKKLIDNLLFLSRNEFGEIQLEQQQVHAKQLVQDIIEYYQCLADAKEISIHVTGDTVLLVDVTLFKQVIANILDNAIHYSQAQKTITISIQPQNTSSPTIEIRDEGLGIAPEHLPHVFQGFYRANDTSHSHHNGLGLAISKSIMRRHNGDITIESTLGTGTTVQLWFNPKGIACA